MCRLLVRLAALGSLLASASVFAQAITVEVKGEGRDLILIPGLVSDSRVWQMMEPELARRYRLHLVELAGFSGQPPISGDLLPTAKSELLTYVKQRQLVRPAVLGHSLGGFLGMWLALDNPGVFGPIISLDGLPYYAAVLAGSNQIQPAGMEARAGMIEAYYASLDSAALQTQAAAGVAVQTVKESNTSMIMAMVAGSDGRSVGSSMATLLRTDLRERLHALTSPLLLLGAIGRAKDTPLEATIRALYQEQLQQARDATLLFNADSGHFLPLDQPEWVMKQVGQFLEEHP